MAESLRNRAPWENGGKNPGYGGKSFLDADGLYRIPVIVVGLPVRKGKPAVVAGAVLHDEISGVRAFSAKKL